MLILTRRHGESLLVYPDATRDPSDPLTQALSGDVLEIAVLDINGSQVKLGIRAPQSLRIVRDELIPTVKQTAS